MQKHILCADIGGTNARFAYFKLLHEELELCSTYTCKTSNLNNTSSVLEAASKTGLDPSQADIQLYGIAGPIDKNKLCAKLTNAKLNLEFKHVNNKIILLNDFSLLAFATLNTKTSNIIPKQANQHATKGILGAGTGLGTAALLPTTLGSWQALQAEGGHMDMPFYDSQEMDFANFAKKSLNKERISAEDIVSARGLSLIHKYVSGEEASPKDVASKLWLNAEKTQESTQLKLYTTFLGRFCKNWALSTLCTGGLYLGGGVLTKNAQILKSPNFIQEFYKCPKTMQEIINNIPIYLMVQENAALWGGAYAAKEILKKAR